MGAWLAVFPCPTINSSVYLCYDLNIYLSIVSVDLSASPDIQATSRGVVPIVIKPKRNGYVGRNGPESRCCCLYYRYIFLAALLDTQHRFDVHLLVDALGGR